MQATVQGLGFVGAFDRRLPRYEHVTKAIDVGEPVTCFDGVLRGWLEVGSLVETLFRDKIEVGPAATRSPAGALR